MLTTEERQRRIAIIRDFPVRLTQLVTPLSDQQLNARPLANEWTVKQIVHHLPDSHMNSVTRLKLILTSDHPTLQPYDQAKWALLPDVDLTPIQASLDILTGLHERWSNLLDSLTDEQRQRTGCHPENGDMTPDDLVVVYSDHCDNHVEQIARTLAAQQ